MAVAERMASIVWEGDVQEGGGKITMDSSGAFGEFAITTIDLKVRGGVPGLDQQGFEDAARQAEQGCPISNALRGNVEISLDAQLEEG